MQEKHTDQDNQENFWEMNDIETSSSSEISAKEMDSFVWEDTETDDELRVVAPDVNLTMHVNEELDLQTVFGADSIPFSLESPANDSLVGDCLWGDKQEVQKDVPLEGTELENLFQNDIGDFNLTFKSGDELKINDDKEVVFQNGKVVKEDFKLENVHESCDKNEMHKDDIIPIETNNIEADNPTDQITSGITESKSPLEEDMNDLIHLETNIYEEANDISVVHNAEPLQNFSTPLNEHIKTQETSLNPLEKTNLVNIESPVLISPEQDLEEDSNIVEYVEFPETITTANNLEDIFNDGGDNGFFGRVFPGSECEQNFMFGLNDSISNTPTVIEQSSEPKNIFLNEENSEFHNSAIDNLVEDDIHVETSDKTKGEFISKNYTIKDNSFSDYITGIKHQNDAITFFDRPENMNSECLDSKETIQPHINIDKTNDLQQIPLDSHVTTINEILENEFDNSFQTHIIDRAVFNTEDDLLLDNNYEEDRLAISIDDGLLAHKKQELEVAPSYVSPNEFNIGAVDEKDTINPENHDSGVDNDLDLFELDHVSKENLFFESVIDAKFSLDCISTIEDKNVIFESVVDPKPSLDSDGFENEKIFLDQRFALECIPVDENNTAFELIDEDNQISFAKNSCAEIEVSPVNNQDVNVDDLAIENIWGNEEDTGLDGLDLLKGKGFLIPQLNEKSVNLYPEIQNTEDNVLMEEFADNSTKPDGNILTESRVEFINNKHIKVQHKDQVIIMDNKLNECSMMEENTTIINTEVYSQQIKITQNRVISEDRSKILPERNHLQDNIIPLPNIIKNNERSRLFNEKITQKRPSLCILKNKIIFSVPIAQKSVDMKSKELVYHYKSVFKSYEPAEKSIYKNLNNLNEQEVKIRNLLKLNERDLVDLLQKRIEISLPTESQHEMKNLLCDKHLFNYLTDSSVIASKESIKKDNWFLALLFASGDSKHYSETLTAMMKKYFDKETLTYIAILLKQYDFALENLHDLEGYWFEYFCLAMRSYNESFVGALMSRIFKYSQLNALFVYIYIKIIHNEDTNIELFKGNIFAIETLFILDKMLTIRDIYKLRESYIDFLYIFDREESYKYFCKNKSSLSKEFLQKVDTLFDEKKWKFGGLRKVVDKSIGKIIGFDFERKSEKKSISEVKADPEPNMVPVKKVSIVKEEKNIEVDLTITEPKTDFYQQKRYTQSLANVSTQEEPELPEKKITQDDTSILINSYLKDDEDDILPKKEEKKEEEKQEKTSFLSRLFGAKKKVYKAKFDSDASFVYDPTTKQWVDKNTTQKPVFSSSMPVKEKAVPKKVAAVPKANDAKGTIRGRYAGGATNVTIPTTGIVIPGVKKSNSEK